MSKNSPFPSDLTAPQLGEAVRRAREADKAALSSTVAGLETKIRGVKGEAITSAVESAEAISRAASAKLSGQLQNVADAARTQIAQARDALGQYHKQLDADLDQSEDAWRCVVRSYAFLKNKSDCASIIASAFPETVREKRVRNLACVAMARTVLESMQPAQVHLVDLAEALKQSPRADAVSKTFYAPAQLNVQRTVRDAIRQWQGALALLKSMDVLPPDEIADLEIEFALQVDRLVEAKETCNAIRFNMVDAADSLQQKHWLPVGRGKTAQPYAAQLFDQVKSEHDLNRLALERVVGDYARSVEG